MLFSIEVKWSRSVMSDSLRSHELGPTRLLRPWDFPGKDTGVGWQFSIEVIPIYIHINSDKDSFYSASSAIPDISCLFDDSHSDSREVLFHLWFQFLFIWWWVLLGIFSMLLWPFVLFFLILIQILCPFFHQTGFVILSCSSSLHILDINPLSDAAFASIFSHSVGCLFVLLIAAFAVRMLFSLMWSHLFIFAFVVLAWGDRQNFC